MPGAARPRPEKRFQTDMSDVFREVDEELRRTRLEEFWKKHGNKVIGLAVLIVVATGGYRGWEYWKKKEAEAAGAKFEQALELGRDKKAEDAAKLLGDLAKEGPDGYRMLARFRLAAETAKKDPAAGAAEWRRLSADAGILAPYDSLAKLRAIMLEMDTGDGKKQIPELEAMAADGQPWRHQARELLGLIAMKAGDFEAAGRWFDRVVIDREAPPSLRQRVEKLQGLVAGGPVKPGG